MPGILWPVVRMRAVFHAWINYVYPNFIISLGKNIDQNFFAFARVSVITPVAGYFNSITLLESDPFAEFALLL